MERIFNKADAMTYPAGTSIKRAPAPTRVDTDDDFIICKGRNIRRSKNHIYFYDTIDDETQMWLQQAMNAAYEECVVENAKEIARTRHLNENLYIHINSPGGGVLSSLALYDFIKNFPMCTVGVVEGFCASGATILLCACQLREMNENSVALVHELRKWDCYFKKYSDIEDEYENVSLLMDRLVNIYTTETKIPADKIRDTLKRDIYWDVNLCKKYELCDVIVGTSLTEAEDKEVDERVRRRLQGPVAEVAKEQAENGNAEKKSKKIRLPKKSKPQTT
jgi:ATP-dependent Clp protease protease subunit